ncbi:MAG TPA: hypothetical protein VHD56_16600 [Tepidisphaeraceae bacterium]|nr:hypothetical protein [Tepidisphaeraceae bacterium]
MSRRRAPITLWIGFAIIIACEVLLFSDVVLTHRGPIKSDQQLMALPEPAGNFGQLARFIAANMTPFAWFGYIIFLDGALYLQSTGSPVRKRPHHFAMISLASVFIWCVFDTFNFYSILAWDYIGMPPNLIDRVIGYFIAFASIVPGMLMSGQLLMNFGLFDWARARSWRMPPVVLWISFISGLAMLLWPMFYHNPVTNLTLWTSLVFLLDPFNYLLGRPSMWRDWSQGWYGRTLACFAGGLMCGFLWEFWNFWALSKWVYHLPFLGPFEHYRYFEMPLPGLIGFVPFGIECWVMWQSIRLPLDGLVEELPDQRHLL